MGKIFRIVGFIVSILAGVWIGWVMFVGSAGTYLSHNPEQLIGNDAAYGEIAADIKQRRGEAEQQVCDAARERFQSAWDKAIDDNNFDKKQASLDDLEKRVDRYCKD